MAFPPSEWPEKFGKNDVSRMISNPFYAITVDPEFMELHEYLVTEDEWIAANLNLMQDIGPEAWMKHLLENLKGDFISNQ